MDARRTSTGYVDGNMDWKANEKMERANSNGTNVNGHLRTPNILNA